MQVNIEFLIAGATVIVGGMALWSNPRRSLNRVFFTLSVHEALWLCSLYKAATTDGLLWVRIINAVGALLPFHFWLVKEASVSGEPWRRIFFRGRWWILSGVLIALLCFTPWFIPSSSSKLRPIYGWGYYTYIVGNVLAFILLSREAVVQLRHQTGIRRVELQSLLIAGSAAALTLLGLAALRTVVHSPWLSILQSMLFLVYTAGTVVAITTHRIFDARQLLLLALQKVSLVGMFAAATFLANYALELFLPRAFAFLATAIVSLWVALELNEWLNRRFRFYPRAIQAREAAFEAARTQTQAQSLERKFLVILKGWGQADHAVVLSGAKDTLRGDGRELAGDSETVRAMQRLKWVTPERLEREKASAYGAILKEFLSENRLGVAVLSEGPTLTLLIGVGVAVSRKPYTYPQVLQLQEIASIIEGALERTHLSAKAQRAEQLATVGLLGASFAHEIRNPLVSIKTFVQLLPKHYQDPAFRDKFFKLIGDEVTRIDRLTEQLLDLASPRAYAPTLIELHPLLRSSLDLATAKANDRKVRIIAEFRASPDQVFTDAAAAKQVLLNLCFNAIQAVENREGDRWIIVATHSVADGVEMTVSDNGPGIDPEIMPLLFQPFRTTKSTGFGLGLAICVDILASLNATLSVDPPTPGLGATFRVVFPCQPSSS